MERKNKELEKKLLLSDDELHQFRIAESDLKEQLRLKEKRFIEIEYEMESRKSKLEHEVSVLSRAKEQLSDELRNAEKKLSSAEREEEKRGEEERKLRKEISRLTYTNDELAEQLQRWKEKSNNTRSDVEPKREKKGESLKMKKLAEIERKLEAIVTMQKGAGRILESDAAEHVEERHTKPQRQKGKQKDNSQSVNTNDQENSKGSTEQIEEVPEEDANSEDMLRHLTSQILEKDELKNDNIVKMFKLDQIQLHDKDNEYKNLLKAMGALYFANKYSKLVPPLFTFWKEQTLEAMQGHLEEEQEDEPQQVEQMDGQIHIRGDTESDPGPDNALEEGPEVIGEELENEADPSQRNEDAEEQEEPEEQEEQEEVEAAQSEQEDRREMVIDTDLANQEAMGNTDTDPENAQKSGEVIHVDDNEWDDKGEGSEESEDMVRNDRMELIEDVDVRPTKGRAKSDQDVEEYFEGPLDDDVVDE